MSESSTKKRVAILIPDLRGGGAERVAVNIANEMALRGYHVDMLLVSAVGQFMADLRPDVQVINFRLRRFRGLLLPLARYLRQRQPNALLAFMWPLTVIAVWARALSHANLRVVVTEHVAWSKSIGAASRFRCWFIRTTMRNTFLSANSRVVVSEGAADDLAKFAYMSRAKLDVIYNPIVGMSCESARPEIMIADWWIGEHRRILSVGTLKDQKDFFTLLEAFSRLRTQMNARLLILGEGQNRHELETTIHKLGISASVFMPGFLRDPTPYYKRTDLYVLTSKYEGFGNVIVEAMAAGTPVVSTDCPSGPREILCDGKYGRLVPVGDPEALARAMAESLAATHDRAALIARAQEFSIAKAVDQYEQLLFPNAHV